MKKRRHPRTAPTIVGVLLDSSEVWPAVSICVSELLSDGSGFAVLGVSVKSTELVSGTGVGVPPMSLPESP